MTTIPQHSSESNEHMTPEWLVEASRFVLGEIDLDPASSEFANKIVRAKKIYTKEQNGLFEKWSGSVLLNPPGGLVDQDGRAVIHAKGINHDGCTKTGECGLPPGHKHQGVTSSATFWWHKLMHEFEASRVTSAMFIGFSLELLQAAQAFVGKQPLDFPCCIPKQRIKFDVVRNGERVSGTQPTHANVIVLVIKNPMRQGPNTFCDPDRRIREHVHRFRETFEQIGYVHVPRGF